MPIIAKDLEAICAKYVAAPDTYVFVEGPRYSPERGGPDLAVSRFAAAYKRTDAINLFPLIVVVDDSESASRNLNNFLWVTFTRSNPAADIFGIESFIAYKHWGCFGSLVIDARSKPHHAPTLEEDPNVVRRVEELAAPGRPLHGII